MSTNLDKSLSDIIAAKPKTRANPPRRAARGKARSSAAKGASSRAATGRAAAPATTNNNRSKPLVIPGRGPTGQQGSKIIVSNLPADVTEQQVKELFNSTIGALKKVSMSYNAKGQPTGLCTVEFQRYDAANKAYQQYNERLVDGKRPLRVEVVVDPAKVAAPAPPAPKPARNQNANTASGSSRGRAGGAQAGRGRGGGRSAGGSKREARPKKSAEDLDAEMDTFMAEGTKKDA